MISLRLTLPWQPLFYSSLVLLSLFFDIRGKIGVILVMFLTLYWSFPPFALLFFVEVHRRRSYVLPYFPARIKSFIIMERWWLIYVILFFLPFELLRSTQGASLCYCRWVIASSNNLQPTPGTPGLFLCPPRSGLSPRLQFAGGLHQMLHRCRHTFVWHF